MKIKIKFDKTNVKINPNGKVESCRDRKKPGPAAFIEFNMDLLHSAYTMFPPLRFLNIFKELAKPDIQGPSESIAGRTDVIPATGHDMYNYCARYGAANHQIQAVMVLDGKLDPERLKKAIRLSLDVEPVFSCRFVENQPPYWERLANIDSVQFCEFEETGNPDEAVQRHMEIPLDMDNDPKIKLKLISCGEYDTLCVKINHICCDGTGIKEYLDLLTDIYTRLDNNEEYVPVPRKRTRADQDRLFKNLGIKDPESAWDPFEQMPRTLWSFPWKHGLPGRPPGYAHVTVCRLPEGQIDKIAKYGKAKGATVNDLIVTAYYRAMFEYSKPMPGIPMDLSMTVDLRRYLPDQKAEAIRNFSGGVDTRLARVSNETFGETLKRVIPMMNRIKNGRPGLQSAIGLERVEKGRFFDSLNFYKKASACIMPVPQCSPILSNLGFLNRSLYKFGSIQVSDAFIIPPAISAPGMLLCIGTYNSVVTLTVSYYTSQGRREAMGRLLRLIRRELVENCRLEEEEIKSPETSNAGEAKSPETSDLEEVKIPEASKPE